MAKPTDSLIETALSGARQAQAHAYAPYSKRHVGAAVITGDGQVFASCNVENKTDSLRVCAERNAIAAAVSSGRKDMRTIIVVSPDHRFWPPCELCRGVIAEFAPGAQIVLSNQGGQLRHGSLDNLPVIPFGGDEEGDAQQSAASPGDSR